MRASHEPLRSCVSRRGTVGHQVKALEAELGLKLFRRERQRLLITEAGRTYLETVRDALDRIAAGTERLLQRQRSGVLTVSTSPNFAAKWLVHRLACVAEAHPDVEKPINPYRVYGDLMKVLDPHNSFVTHESGNTRDQLSTVFDTLIPRGFLWWGNVSALGFSLAAVIAAKKKRFQTGRP